MEDVFQADGQAQVLNSFQRCGVVNACDGSEDDLIKIQGYSGSYNLDTDDEDGGEDDDDHNMCFNDTDDSDAPIVKRRRI